MLTGSWSLPLALCKRPHLGLLLLASIMAPALLFLAYAVQSRQIATASMEDRMGRHAAVLAEHVHHVFGSYGLMFDSVEHMLIHQVPGAVLTARMKQMVDRADFAGSLLVLDRAGRIVDGGLSDGLDVDVADLAYFLRALDGPGIVVSGRILGRVTGQQLFGLSRRTADGRIMVALLFPRYFQNVFGAVAGQDGLDGVVSLLRADGTQLASYPMLEAPVDLPPGYLGLMQTPRESGVYRVTSPRSGGGERAFGFHRVRDYPVYVTYGVNVSEAMAPWRASVGVGGLLAAVAAALLMGSTMVAIRRVEESGHTEAQLQKAVAARTAEAVVAIRDREAALRMAEQAHNAKAHFLAAASHDLRQPIQALRLFLEVLDGRMDDAENLRILGHASKALKGAEDLLGALLDVSTLDAGMVAAATRPVALDEVLCGLAEEFGTQARACFLDFRYVPTSAWVETDAVLLSRLLRNLLTNALRYTETGRVLLGCRHAGTGIRIEIWDTGPGIPADKLEAVFEDFVQLGNPERDRSKGLGLGLAVVRRMAVLLGHPVEVRSTEGRGTVFSVRLRRCELPLPPGKWATPLVEHSLSS